MQKSFILISGGEQRPVELIIGHAYNIGYAGRNQEVVRKHIEELAQIGVQGPAHLPTIYPVDCRNVTTDTNIQVIHDITSGEVEYALFLSEGERYITISSDHSDRELEKASVPMAKQICPNFVAPQVWKFSEVADHFDDLIMRCYVTQNGVRSLYQEGRTAELIAPNDQIGMIEEYLGEKPENTAIFSGTLPTKDGMICGEKYEIELEDPLLKRSIKAVYAVERLRDPRE